MTKNTKEIKNKNANELARESQKRTSLLVLASVGFLILVGWFFVRPHNHEKSSGHNIQEDSYKEAIRLDGTVDTQFTKESYQMALEEQQRELKELREKLDSFNAQVDLLQISLDEKHQKDLGEHKDRVHELQSKIANLEIALGRSDGNIQSLGSIRGGVKGITTTTFSYTQGNQRNNYDRQPISGLDNSGLHLDKNADSDKSTSSESIKTIKNYVPAGTFAQAVLLSGADTNAGVHGQTDTTPVTLRILDNGTLPNGKHSSLKGCFVTAAAYGDASSERGQIRLQRLSCVRKPEGQVLDILVEGTINDMGGSDGIRGHVVMRNNKLIWNAGVSGFLSGIGSAMQQSLSTQSISPSGVTSVLKSGKAFENSAYGGVNTALGKLADYYIKLADMYHPIVQVHAGSKVNIVFLQGFSLDYNQRVGESISTKNRDAIEGSKNTTSSSTIGFDSYSSDFQAENSDYVQDEPGGPEIQNEIKHGLNPYPEHLIKELQLGDSVESPKFNSVIGADGIEKDNKI